VALTEKWRCKACSANAYKRPSIDESGGNPAEGREKPRLAKCAKRWQKCVASLAPGQMAEPASKPVAARPVTEPPGWRKWTTASWRTAWRNHWTRVQRNVEDAKEAEELNRGNPRRHLVENAEPVAVREVKTNPGGRAKRWKGGSTSDAKKPVGRPGTRDAPVARKEGKGKAKVKDLPAFGERVQPDAKKMRRHRPDGRGTTTTWHCDDELKDAGKAETARAGGPPPAAGRVVLGHTPASEPRSVPAEDPRFGAACDQNLESGEGGCVAPASFVDELNGAAVPRPPQLGSPCVGSEWSWSSEDELAAEFQIDESQSTPAAPDEGWGIPVGSDPTAFANEPDPGCPPQAYSKSRAAADLYARVQARRKERDRLGLRVTRNGRGLQLVNADGAPDRRPAEGGNRATAQADAATIDLERQAGGIDASPCQRRSPARKSRRSGKGREATPCQAEETAAQAEERAAGAAMLEWADSRGLGVPRQPGRPAGAGAGKGDSGAEQPPRKAPRREAVPGRWAENLRGAGSASSGDTWPAPVSRGPRQPRA
jgi:hypothetical protein